MTWGMLLPGNFGQFWPSSEAVDAAEKVKHHAMNVMTDEERLELAHSGTSLLAHASMKFRRDMGRIEEFEQTSVFRTRKTYSKLGSFIQLNNGLLAVDEPLRDIIEELEPGVHQFWPMQITMPKDVAFPKSYHALVIHNHLDAFRREESEPGAWATTGVEHISTHGLPEKKSISGMAMSLDAIGSKHLWREKFVHGPDIFMSEALKARIDAAGLKIPPKHYKMLDV
jgi:hypothetical protein